MTTHVLLVPLALQVDAQLVLLEDFSSAIIVLQNAQEDIMLLMETVTHANHLALLVQVQPLVILALQDSS